MKLIATLLALAGSAMAYLNYDDWKAPTEGDLRGPCPALNALANHGFLPRDGKNITLPVLLAGTAAVNLTAEVTTGLFLAGIRTSSDPSSGAFTLRDLKKHNIIEHDGSLSRGDTGTPSANDQDFNPDVYAEFKSFFHGAEQVSLGAAAEARWGRVKSARASNDKFTYGASQRFNGYAETAVYFQVLVDPRTGKVPVEWLDVLFAEERLPSREGWRPPQTPISGLGSAGVILQLAMATDEKAGDLVPPPQPSPSSGSASTRKFSHAGEMIPMAID